MDIVIKESIFMQHFSETSKKSFTIRDNKQINRHADKKKSNSNLSEYEVLKLIQKI